MLFFYSIEPIVTTKYDTGSLHGYYSIPVQTPPIPFLNDLLIWEKSVQFWIWRIYACGYVWTSVL